jgi:thioredoxin-dependent peroxiredoxin
MVELKNKPVQLGAVAPDFIAETTQGKIHFHEWMGDSWCILFSHPKDFTPVCTTELGTAAKLQPEFSKRHVKLIALSVGSVADHEKWIPDINKTQNAHLTFPIIGDEHHTVAELYQMIHPQASDTATVRAVFVIDPKKTIRLILIYPASTGRNFQELLRIVDSLQLTDKHKVATPADWKKGDDCAILPSVTDAEEIKRLFPQGFRQVTSYLRLTPDPSCACSLNKEAKS